MKNSNALLAPVALSLFAATSPTAGAGVVFTATTKAESPTARLVTLADSTVRGWVEGDRGKVEFLESGNGAWPKGSILLTGDRGQTVRFFDVSAKKCRPWSPLGGIGPHRSVAGAENLRVEKTLDEPGPKIAGLATRHYRFVITYDTRLSSASDVLQLRTERVDDVWVAPGLSDPGLAVWLKAQAPRTGNEKLDGELARAMAKVRGAALKRVTVEKVERQGRPPQTTTTTVEVTALERQQVNASIFLDPFPCKIVRPEDRR